MRYRLQPVSPSKKLLFCESIQSFVKLSHRECDRMWMRSCLLEILFRGSVCVSSCPEGGAAALRRAGGHRLHLGQSQRPPRPRTRLAWPNRQRGRWLLTTSCRITSPCCGRSVKQLDLSTFPGLGAKANDSLDMMFDVTTYGEYNSCSASRLGQSQPHDEDHNQENKDENNDDGDGRFLGLEKLSVSFCDLPRISPYIWCQSLYLTHVRLLVLNSQNQIPSTLRAPVKSENQSQNHFIALTVIPTTARLQFQRWYEFFSLCISCIRHPSFAHVAVIRKKDERRKLKGTTCKECEVVSISDVMLSQILIVGPISG